MSRKRTKRTDLELADSTTEVPDFTARLAQHGKPCLTTTAIRSSWLSLPPESHHPLFLLDTGDLSCDVVAGEAFMQMFDDAHDIPPPPKRVAVSSEAAATSSSASDVSSHT